MASVYFMQCWDILTSLVGKKFIKSKTFLFVLKHDCTVHTLRQIVFLVRILLQNWNDNIIFLNVFEASAGAIMPHNNLKVLLTFIYFNFDNCYYFSASKNLNLSLNLCSITCTCITMLKCCLNWDFIEC